MEESMERFEAMRSKSKSEATRKQYSYEQKKFIERLAQENLEIEACSAEFVYLYIEEISTWKEDDISTRKKRKHTDEFKTGIKSTGFKFIGIFSFFPSCL